MKWYYYFPIVFAFLSVLILAGALYWSKARRSAGTAAAAGDAPPAARPAGSALCDFWQVTDVREGIITLQPGNRYRLICRLAAQDFYLMGESEQSNVEDALRSALLGLDYPVQLLVTSEAVDTRSIVYALRENVSKLPAEIAEHALARAEYLEAMMANREVSARLAYLVVPVETDKGFSYAKGELYARLGSLADALSQAKVKLEPLDSAGVCDLLAHLLNRGRAWRPSLAVQAGVLAEFHVSESEAV